MRTIALLSTLLILANDVTAYRRAFGVSSRSFVSRLPRGGKGDDYNRYGSGYGYGGGDDPEDDPYRRGDNDDYYGQPDPYQDDRYYDYEDRGMDRGRPRGEGSVMSSIPQVIKTGNRKIGLPLLGVGAALTFLGVTLFFNKALMRLGNLFFIAGVPMTIGPGRTAGYFFQPKKARATACLSLGIFLVFVGWPLVGILLEAFGFLNLFGNMFPFAMAILKTMPIIGPMLRGNGNGSKRRDRYRDDEDDYDDYGGGGGFDRGYDDRGYYDGDGQDDYNRPYY